MKGVYKIIANSCIFSSMPTVFEFKGYRFYFYSNENDEPVHIHIEKAEANAKFWLVPVIKEAYAYGFKAKERKEIANLVKKHSKQIIDAWNGYFKQERRSDH